MLRQDQAAIANHADQASRRVRAATEPENINFVALFVLFGQEFIALHNVQFQTGADATPDETVIPLRAYSFVVPFELLDPIRPDVFNRVVETTNVGFHLPIRRQLFVGRPVPCSIKTNHNSFHSFSPIKLALLQDLHCNRFPAAKERL